MNPNRLIPASSAESVTEVSWIGQKDNYTINVLWAKDGAVDEFGVEYGFNLDINLFIDPGNIDFSKQDDSELNSGELENVEIEENLDSGEEISGDVVDIISGELETTDEVLNDISGEEIIENNEVSEEVNSEEKIIESEQVEGEGNE